MDRLIIAICLLSFGACLWNVEPIRLTDRIIDGHNVNIENYPHQVSLQHNGDHICGGVIVSTEHILTAAHCTEGRNISSLSIRAGSSKHDSGGQIVFVHHIYQHPDYNADTKVNDISLLFLTKNLTVGQAACLPVQGEEPSPGDDADITGWGYLSDNVPNRIPEQLQAAKVPIISRADCNKAYNTNTIGDGMICAGYLDFDGADACQGDSGGPLMVDGKLAGIVSYGYGCGNHLYPGVYTNVGYYRSLIKEQTGI